MIRRLALVAALSLAPACGRQAALPQPRSAELPGAATVHAAALDQIERRIARHEATWSQARDKRAIFATTYRLSTRNFRKAISAGAFEDGARLEKAVIAFGLLYFDAIDTWEAGERDRTPAAWRRAFARAADPRSNVATNLVLGMNAHIIRDLPFAAASLAPMDESWHRDFLRCNAVLTAEVPEVRQEIVRRYGSWGPSPRDAERWDDVLAGQAVVVAREISWRHALEIDRDRVKGGAATEAYSENLAATLDQDRILWALWEWLRRSTQGFASNRL